MKKPSQSQRSWQHSAAQQQNALPMTQRQVVFHPGLCMNICMLMMCACRRQQTVALKTLVDWTERRSKLLAIADNFAAVVNGAILAVVTAARGSSGNNNGQTSTQRIPRPVVVKGGALPECIQANREPYLQGDWRREPYIPRYSLFGALIVRGQIDS